MPNMQRLLLMINSLIEKNKWYPLLWKRTGLVSFYGPYYHYVKLITFSTFMSKVSFQMSHPTVSLNFECGYSFLKWTFKKKDLIRVYGYIADMHQKLLKNAKNRKLWISALPDVAFHKNVQILTILLGNLVFLSNFWQNHIW